MGSIIIMMSLLFYKMLDSKTVDLSINLFSCSSKKTLLKSQDKRDIYTIFLIF
jgi:hypothetical protein